MSNNHTIPDWIANGERPRFVICVSHQGDELTVLQGKVYRVLPPEPNDRLHDLRVVDETGEDYLYDPAWFMPIEVPQRVVDALEAA